MSRDPRDFHLEATAPSLELTKDSSDFEIWKTKWRSFLGVSGISRLTTNGPNSAERVKALEEVKRDALYSALSKDTMRTLRNLPLSEEQRDKAEDVIAALQKHVEGSSSKSSNNNNNGNNKRVFRKQLHDRMKTKGESFDAYAKALKELSKKCEFKSTKNVEDDWMLDTLIANVNDKEITETLLKLDDGKTFEDAVKIVEEIVKKRKEGEKKVVVASPAAAAATTPKASSASSSPSVVNSTWGKSGQNNGAAAAAAEPPKTDTLNKYFWLNKCTYKCAICDNWTTKSRISFDIHTNSVHKLSMNRYRNMHGDHMYQVIKTKCHMCDKDVVNDFKDFDQHLTSEHEKMTISAYHDKFITLIKSQLPESELPLENQAFGKTQHQVSQVSSSSAKKQQPEPQKKVEEVEPKKKTPAGPKSSKKPAAAAAAAGPKGRNGSGGGKAAKKAPLTAKKIWDDEEEEEEMKEDEEEEEDLEETSESSDDDKPLIQKKKNASKNGASDDDDFNPDLSGDEGTKRKTTQRKRKAAPAKFNVDSDEEEEEEDLPKNKKGKAGPASKTGKKKM